MKRALVLFAVLLLSSTLTWAQRAGSAPAPVADPRAAGGSCLLPDLAGLTHGQIAAAALNAGFQVTFEAALAYPACPVTFHCNSMANCVIGPTCTVTNIGDCCSNGGTNFCCKDGADIMVTACPCRCASPSCPSTCLDDSEVSSTCS